MDDDFEYLPEDFYEGYPEEEIEPIDTIERGMNIVLVAKDGYLYYPDYVKDCYSDPGPILLHVYAAGDCDCVKWPNPNMDHLVGCLFDGREMGYTHVGDVVMLPDRTVVEF